MLNLHGTTAGMWFEILEIVEVIPLFHKSYMQKALQRFQHIYTKLVTNKVSLFAKLFQVSHS